MVKPKKKRNSSGCRSPLPRLEWKMPARLRMGWPGFGVSRFRAELKAPGLGLRVVVGQPVALTPPPHPVFLTPACFLDPSNLFSRPLPPPPSLCCKALVVVCATTNYSNPPKPAFLFSAFYRTPFYPRGGGGETRCYTGLGFRVCCSTAGGLGVVAQPLQLQTQCPYHGF